MENPEQTWSDGLKVWLTTNPSLAGQRNPRVLYHDLIDFTKHKVIRTRSGTAQRFTSNKAKPVGLVACSHADLPTVAGMVLKTCGGLGIDHCVTVDLLKWFAVIADRTDSCSIVSRFYFTEEKKCLHFFFMYYPDPDKGFVYSLLMAYGVTPVGHHAMYRRYKEAILKEEEDGRKAG